MQSFYIGDCYNKRDQDVMSDNNQNIMERVNDTSSYHHDMNNDFDENSLSNRWDGLANLTNLMSNNSTDSLLFDNHDNNTNITNPFLTGEVFKSVNGTNNNSINCNATFDPNVFWGVNAFILFLVLMTLLCCCFGKWNWLFYNAEDGRQVSDEIHRQMVLQRRREQQEAKKETPAKRTQNILQSFALNKVQMTVKEEDLIQEDPSHRESEESDTRIDDDIETGSLDDHGHLKLTNGNLVPNCCAICLTCYHVNDVVVWSSNKACAHSFHQDCIVSWLVKIQPETPCPCCRQEFTDLERIRKESKVTWGCSNAFNINALSL